ncbi:hypothetical protein GCM10010503_64100 [Streptomyces lucensis JCM 4490]|uniref:Integral membrane protein n=1 Tax=Streptomyces lucensis JCM 4490 TaxID=1306176 RepID=A0A918JEW7_9ACTN|nr:hypothetical protein [Streptomyces lucensis]GGW77378.1 hypothetical protein GCM10010503_64100 [Streptomyces lucensis JCM 4490]
MTRTPPTTVTPVRLWRWRRNPLRRHSDVVEAWVVLVTWILVLVGGVLAGVLAAQATDAAFAARRAQLHQVSAVLTDGAVKTPPASTGYDDGRVWAAVRWTDKDGSVHTGRTKVFPGAPGGSRVTVWTDRAGRVVAAPVTGAAAGLQSALTGVLVAPSAGAAVWAAGWFVRGRLIRRRMAEWDEEWKQIGPRWGNFSGT